MFELGSGDSGGIAARFASSSFVIIDSFPLCRLALRRLIEGEGWHVVGEASSIEEAAELLVGATPQVIVLDVRATDGVSRLRRLQEMAPRAQILATAAVGERAAAEMLLESGASGYVSKGAPIATILTALERVRNGQVYIEDDLRSAMLNRTLRQRTTSASETFTPREREVYEMIGRGLSVKQIAGALHLSPKTVEYHRQNLKRKLGLGSSHELARHAAVSQREAASGGNVAEG